MGSGISEYIQLVKQLKSYSNVPNDMINSLWAYTLVVYNADLQSRFNEPMPWIGMYIALASLFCILAMVVDLVHGFRNKKLWFPCKYFTLNAASLSVIAVAMKLPMDLNNSMPGDVDQAAKLGSMAFMCTMMSHLLPSLGTLNNKELVTNIIALGVLVITLVVNVCIQIKTGVVSSNEIKYLFGAEYYPYSTSSYNKPIAIIYVTMLLMLLIIHASSSLAILKSKQILESKYQVAHETHLKDQKLQQPGRLSTVEKLKQLVTNYWIMAGTGSPQFMTACSATTSASGVICSLSTVLHVLIMIFTIGTLLDFNSDYKWSMLVILMIQFIGSVLGTIAPLSRCFAALSFKLSRKWIWNNMKVFKVESYWTRMLFDLKDSSIPFQTRSRKLKIVVQNLKVLILNFCIGFQMAVVVASKMISLIPIFIVICIFNCLCCWKWLKLIFSEFPIVLVKEKELQQTSENLSHYVLQLEDDMELAERTLKRIIKSVDHLIKKAKKQQPGNLMNLLDGTRRFGRSNKFDSHHVLPLLLEEPLSSWSLTLVTLTTIAISLHNIQKNRVDSLLSGVSEGLVYVTLVEEILITTENIGSIQKAAQTLWLEVEFYQRWLENKLQKRAPQVHTAKQHLQWLRDTAKNIVSQVEGVDTRGQNIYSKRRSISANSMYRITETLLLSYQADIDEVSQEELFVHLSSMIADILAVCLTNLPQVIIMKCHSSVIEKREACVYAAAQLLGETSQIINTFQDHELPSA